MAIDPRLKDVQDMRAVQKGPWFILEDLAEVKAGTAAVPVTSYENSHTLNSAFSRFMGLGTHFVTDIYTEVGVAGVAVPASVYATGLRARAEYQGLSASGGGVYGIEAEAILGAAATHNGVIAAGQFYLRMDARAAPYNYSRTAACISLRSNIGANIAWTADLMQAFIRAGDAGALNLPFFLYWAQAPAAGSAVRPKTATNLSTVCIAVSINGADYFIPLYDNEA